MDTLKFNFTIDDMKQLLNEDKDLLEDLICLVNHEDDATQHLIDKLSEQAESAHRAKERQREEELQQSDDLFFCTISGIYRDSATLAALRLL